MTAPVVNPLPYDNTTPEGLLQRALLLKGNTFREILDADPNLKPEEKEKVLEVAKSNSAKGSLGHIIEENFFYYNKNSSKEADFPEAGVELKVSPYLKTGKGLRAKERLVLTIINYKKDYDKPFEESHLFLKCKLMLLIYYFYEKNKSKLDYLINYVDLFQIPIEDFEIIKRDYDTILQKIRDGKAHEISEGDTLYLGACTKGVNHTSMQPQPFSTIPAKQRAFCLKNSYMSVILNEYFAKGIHTYNSGLYIHKLELEKLKKEVNYGKLIHNYEDLNGCSLEEYVLKKLVPHYGRNADDLLKEFGVDSTAKNNYAILARKMLGVNQEKIVEFEKANISIKTIRLKSNGVPKEAMSFPAFKYMDIVKQDFYDSDLYTRLSEDKFLFMIFEFTDANETNLIFKKAMFWNTPGEDLEGKIKIGWERVKSNIMLGEYNDLLKVSDDMIIHVRPHARNAADTFPTPQGGQETKKCFWLNQKYIKEQIEKGGN